MTKYLNRFEVPDTAKYVIIPSSLLTADDLSELDKHWHVMMYKYQLRRIADNFCLMSHYDKNALCADAWSRGIPYEEVSFIN